MVEIKHPKNLRNACHISRGREFSDALGSLWVNGNPERGQTMTKEGCLLDGKDNFQRLYVQASVAQPRQDLGDVIKMLVKIRTKMTRASKGYCTDFNCTSRKIMSSRPVRTRAPVAIPKGTRQYW
jgi:hypothetical protein